MLNNSLIFPLLKLIGISLRDINIIDWPIIPTAVGLYSTHVIYVDLIYNACVKILGLTMCSNSAPRSSEPK